MTFRVLILRLLAFTVYKPEHLYRNLRLGCIQVTTAAVSKQKTKGKQTPWP
jgi:hypothetical protein